jgi:hypothetical protein
MYGGKKKIVDRVLRHFLTLEKKVFSSRRICFFLMNVILMERLPLPTVVQILSYMTMTERLKFASIWPDIIKNIFDNIDWVHCRLCGEYLILESGPCAVCGGDEFTYQHIYTCLTRNGRK